MPHNLISFRTDLIRHLLRLIRYGFLIFIFYFLRENFISIFIFSLLKKKTNVIIILLSSICFTVCLEPMAYYDIMQSVPPESAISAHTVAEENDIEAEIKENDDNIGNR